MRTGGKRGMQTLEQALAQLVEDGEVLLEDALACANDQAQLRRLVERPRAAAGV
jgi:Tfp pilus assembly ATPase PilU